VNPLHITTSGLVTYPAGATFGPRRMSEFELVWVIEGDCEFRRDDIAYPCPAESMVMCLPETTDFFRWDPKRPTRHAYFHFRLEPGHPLPPRATWPVVQACVEGDVIRPMFRHLLTWRDRENGPAELALTNLMAWGAVQAFVLGRSATAALLETALPDPVERALALVRRRLEADARTPVELAQLAKAAGVSEEHLCRLFRKHTGHSPAETVRLARLDRAAALLARSNYSVGEVADLCGFASQFHFSRAFKAAFGEPPTELRERVREGGLPPTPKLLRKQK
jgi:AraC family transcriptional regulator